MKQCMLKKQQNSGLRSYRCTDDVKLGAAAAPAFAQSARFEHSLQHAAARLLLVDGVKEDDD